MVAWRSVKMSLPAIFVVIFIASLNGSSGGARFAPPQPNSFEDPLPDTSDPVVIQEVSIPDVSIRVECYEWVTWHPAHEILRIFHYFAHPIPRDLRLQYRVYWERIETERLVGPDTFTYNLAKKHGATVTEINDLSSELGVSYDSLSAKLSKSFGHNVSITKEEDLNHQYLVRVSKGKRAVWTLWHRVEVFVFVDHNNQVVSYRSYAEGDGAPYAFGISRYKNCSISLPTTTMVHHTTDLFPDEVGF
jgi:hypothetical protein